MFLDYIEISNFRPYYGNQRINFGYAEDKNLTIILADNGSGKTSLVNALTWCLYGKELHDVRDKNEPIYNLKAANEAEIGGFNELKVKVKIRFYYIDTDSNKRYFTVSREIPYQKWNDNQWTSVYSSHLIVDETGKNILDGDRAQSAIDNKIPENMFQYFFFNGATLSNYFNNSSSKLNLKNSIKQISQLGLIDSMSNHLTSTLKTLNSEYNKLNNGGGIDYNALIESKLSEKEELESKIKDNHNKIDESNKIIANCNRKLELADSERVKVLVKDRKNHENEQIKLKKSIESSIDEYNDLIIELYPIAVLFDELVESIEIANEARNKKTIPPLIESTLLNDILEEGYCICGVKLENHPECVEELKKRLNETTNLPTDDFYKHYYNIKKTLSKLHNLTRIEELRNSIQNNKTHFKQVRNQISSIETELKNNDIENVRVFEEQRDKNKKMVDKLRKDNIIFAEKIKEIKIQITQYKKDREKIRIENEHLNYLSELIKFSENAKYFVSNLNEEVQRHIREKVSNKTNEQFININWANNKYTSVKIEDDYRIVITKSSGNKVRPGDLSDGEENLLALSFMMALHSLSGFEIPLIIDAPLEKLDKSKRLDFISNLHEYTKDKQIIFLFTDSQYTDDVRAYMLKNICDEYELKPQEYETEIVKHE